MIKFDLGCENGHIFEASFDDSASFEKQRKKNQIECPFCNSSKISKGIFLLVKYLSKDFPVTP